MFEVSRLGSSPDASKSFPWPVRLFLAALVALPLLAIPRAQAQPSSGAVAGRDPVPAVDLRPLFEQWGLGPNLQGDRPTCSTFTVAGALEFAVAKRQGQSPRLSVEFLNWAANRACGDKEDGGFFSDLWKGFAEYGICTAQDWPYQPAFNSSNPPPPSAMADAKSRMGLGLRLNWIKEWNVNTGLTDAHLVSIKQTLANGWVVCGGFRWPKQERWIEDVLQMCPPDAVRDGHSVLLVGYRDDTAQPGGGIFIFRNSTNGGRDGLMPYAYSQAYMNDAAWIDYPARSTKELDAKR